MMRNILTRMRLALAVVAAIGGAFGVLPAHAGGDLFAPAVTVNGTVITRFELSQRLALLQVMRQPGDLAQRALDDLITDRLQLEAAKAFGITVSGDAVKAGMAEFAGRANLTTDAFMTAIGQNAVQPETFRDFVTAGVAWRSVVRAKFGGRVSVTDAEIDRAIADGAASGGTLRAQLSELILIDDGKSDVVALARRIRDKIKTPSDFSNAARVFSKVNTAGNGGALGWVDVTVLPPEVARAIAGLKPGEISQPVRQQGAVGLYLLSGQSVGAGPAKGAPDVDYAVFAPGAARDVVRLQASSTGCAALDVASRGLPAAALQRQTVAEAAVPASLRSVLAGLDAGESAVVAGAGGVPELVML